VPSDLEKLAADYLNFMHENVDSEEIMDEASRLAEAELQATVDILMQKGQAANKRPFGKITAASHPVLRLESIIKNAIAYKVGDWGRDPKIKIKGKSEYFEIPYGSLRKLSANDSNTLTIEDYPGEDPLRIPSGGLEEASKSSGIQYSEDANFWIGPTKATLFSVFDDSTNFNSVKTNKKQAAVFSMAVKSVKLQANDSPNTKKEWKNGGKLTITLYNKPGKGSSFPSPDFKQYIPLEVSDSKYDDAPILIGHYVDPTKPSVDDMMSNLFGGFTYDLSNGVLNTAADTTNGLLRIAQETAIDAQFYCCIFYEIMKNQPELLDYLAEHELDPNNLSPAKIWMLEKEKGRNVKYKSMLTGNIAKVNNGMSLLEVAGEFIEEYEEEGKKINGLDAKIWSWLFDQYSKGGKWTLSTMISALAKVEERLIKIDEEIIYYETHPMSLQDFLNEQKLWIQDVKSIAEILLALLETKYGKVGWSAIMFNITQLTTNCVQLILMTMVDTIREHLMEKSVEWVYKKKKEFEDEADDQASEAGHCFNVDGGYETSYGDKETCEQNGHVWKPGSTYYSAAVKCLPWEKVLLLLITSIFGKDGFFKSVQSFIQRIKNMMLLKQKNKAINDSWENDPKNVEESRLVPLLKGLINMCDWLLDLNAEGILLCNKYKKSDRDTAQFDETGLVSDGAGSIITTGISDDIPGTGDGDIEGVGVGGAGGKEDTGTFTHITSKFGSSMLGGDKIDITNSDINPISLLVLQEDEDVQKFMMQYMGLSSDEAAEATTGAKKGECLKTMSAEDIQELQEILNKAGTGL
tara:strand:- start:1313 stop:3724 length:2412 start_codon:yes stop_codon:yes gene_type:complete